MNSAVLRSTRGAVYVEFMIAVVPLFMMFWGLMQLNGFLVADIVTRHAAVNAVRAAIVCDSDEKTKGESGAVECATEAAKMTTKAVQSIEKTTVAVRGASESGNGPVIAQVSATYHCQVPLMARVVCGGSDSRTIVREATLPNQGHYYKF